MYLALRVDDWLALYLALLLQVFTFCHKLALVHLRGQMKLATTRGSRVDGPAHHGIVIWLD